MGLPDVHKRGFAGAQLTTNQATLVLAGTGLFRCMVNELSVTLGAGFGVVVAGAGRAGGCGRPGPHLWGVS
jgi:hypothetical protein